MIPDDGSEPEIDHSPLAEIGYLFSPLVALTTSTVSGIEVLPRLRDPVHSPLTARTVRTDRVGFDVLVAVDGLWRAVELEVHSPLHINLLADTVAAGPEVLGPLHAAAAAAGIRPDNVVIEIGRPVGDPHPDAVVLGSRALREQGFQLCLDEIGPHDSPLALLDAIAPDQVKLHPELVAGLGSDRTFRTVAGAVRRLARELGATLMADGLDTTEHLDAVRDAGVTVGQGRLLAEPARRPRTQVAVPARLPVVPRPRRPQASSRPAADHVSETVGGFARPVTSVPTTVTGDVVRDLFRSAAVTSVVLVDDAQRPVGVLDRNRFLLAVSGQFGHALHARRAVADLADPPRILHSTADPRSALDVLSSARAGHVYDDLVVVDGEGRCVGVAPVGDLLRGIAELNHDRALALHPVTRLPGLPTVADAFDDQLATAPAEISAAVLEPDLDELIDRGGHRAVVDGLHALARAVRDAVTAFDDVLAAHATGDTIVILARPHQTADLGRTLHTTIRTARKRLPAIPATSITWHRIDATDISTDQAFAALLRSAARGSHPGRAAPPRRYVAHSPAAQAD